MKTVLFAAFFIYVGAMQMFDLYIIYIYLMMLKSILLVQRIQGQKTQPGES